MAKLKLKKSKPQPIPKFVSTEIMDQCVVYELSDILDDGYVTSCVFKAKKNIRKVESDFVVEDVKKGEGNAFVFDIKNSHMFFPDEYGEQDLVWYNDVDDIDEVVAICCI